MPANRPTAPELLAAIEGFLKDEALPALEGSEAYHMRVALSALAIVAREIEQGPALDEAERARLTAVLGIDGALVDLNRLLCGRIRQRVLTYKDRGLMAHLRATAMGKMAIDNPRYATYAAALQRAGAAGPSRLRQGGEINQHN